MALGEEKFYVQILGAASSEKVLLEHSLKVGSEVELGLKVEHPHLSAEHCTVSLQSGVLSLIDHNSDLGVLINGKKIPPNKMMIILPSDEIKMGDLQLKIHCYEDESISDDHATKILSLDDLFNEESKQQQPESVVDRKDRVNLEAPADEDESSIKLTMENVLETLKPEEVKEDINEQVALIMPSEDTIIKNEGTKEFKKSTNEKPKNSTDQLAKFKRSGKLSDTQSIGIEKSQVTKKVVKKNSKTSSKYFFAQFNSVSFPLRIFAFFLDMILGIRLSLYLIEIDIMEFFSPVTEFINFSFDFVFNLHPDTADLAPQLMSFSTYFVGYLVLRVLGNVVFGVSPGQFLIGCWNDGNFTIKRLLGPIRELLGFILAPLVVFDLPALFSKKTIKEMLTMTCLECYNKTLSYFLALTMIPVSIVLAFFTPLFLQNFSSEEISFSLDSQKIQLHEDLSSVKSSPSNFFHLNTSWSNKLYGSYLNFKAVQNKENIKVYIPRITLFPMDITSSLLIRLERKKEFFWSEHLDQMIKMYPILTKRFESFDNTKIKNSKDYSTQLKQVILDSFQLKPENILAFIFNYGPYIDPFLNFKNKLTKYFQAEVESIEFWKNADLDFMIVSTKSSDVAGRWKDLYVLPLTKEKTYVYQFSYLKGTLPKSKNLMKQFLAIAKIQSKISVNMKEWKGMELSSPELLDFYTMKSLTERDKAVMSPFIYRYYWDIGKNVVAGNFDLFWADYVNNLKTSVGMLSEMNIEARKLANPENDPLSDVGYDHLIKKLSFLRESIKNKQTDAFQVFKYP